MSSRRLARGGPKVAATGHAELSEKGKDSPVWQDPLLAQQWLQMRGLPAAPAAYESSPRALRDHAANEWAKAEGIVNRWGLANWARLRSDYGIPPTSGARTRARLSAGIRFTASDDPAPF